MRSRLKTSRHQGEAIAEVAPSRFAEAIARWEKGQGPYPVPIGSIKVRRRSRAERSRAA